MIEKIDIEELVQKGDLEQLDEIMEKINQIIDWINSQ